MSTSCKIFGTNDERGAAHGIYEIIANAIDEAREGFGDKIKISIMKDGTVEVIDHGRGIPMGWNDAEQMYNWELVFCTLYASGKYESDNYGRSLGLNGLGATAMQYASEFMDVYSTRDGKTSYMRFEKGKPVGELKVTDANGRNNGTMIRFKPDSEVFIGIKNQCQLNTTSIYYVDKQCCTMDLKLLLFHEEIGKDIV